MECPVGFRGNAIFEFYKKQGLDLRADLKKVPNNNHENLVHFLSNCTLAGLLCSRMLNCCRWSPPPAAATSAATANANAPARQGRHRAGLSPLVPAASLQRCRCPAPSIIACALAIRVPSELDLRIQVGLGTQLVRPDTWQSSPSARCEHPLAWNGPLRPFLPIIANNWIQKE